MRKKRRKLSDRDLKKARIPKRYWESSFDMIRPDDSRHKKIIARYLKEMDVMISKGIGFLFWGNNGTGKTSCACLLLKEARRQGFTSLFCRAFDIKDLVIENKNIKNDIRKVDLLVIDDLGKEYSGESGFVERICDGIFRERGGDMKPTIVTSNMSPKMIKDKYKTSMIEGMSESIIPVKFASENYRETNALEIRKFAIDPVIEDV